MPSEVNMSGDKTSPTSCLTRADMTQALYTNLSM